MSLAETMESSSLAQTIGAPLSELDGDVPTSPPTLSGSILPRVEATEHGLRLERPVGPRYALVKQLGAGAMGEVALVEDRDIGRTVALKKLRIQGSLRPQHVARFVDEVRTVGRLEHPNIVPIHDVGVDEGGSLYFIMKHVDGEDLESILERLRAKDPATLAAYDRSRRVGIVIDVLRALAFAHAHGILHRDLKPANIMIGKHGEVLLMDWGVARSARGHTTAPLDTTRPDYAPSHTTQAGVLIGTPLYMSPEQARGANDALDARSDLYAITVVLHELLTTRHRLEGESSLPRLLDRIQHEDPRPQDLGELPADLMWFVRRGLERDPRDRWPTAEAMIAELTAILEGRCRVQCPVTATKRVTTELGRWVEHRPMLVLSILGAASLAATSSIVYSVVRLVGG